MRSEKLTRTQLARREDIIGAAVAVLGRDGYAGASIERIAAEANTSKSTVLYHFDTKESVYTAVVERLYERGRVYMAERLSGERPVTARFHTYLDASLRFIADHALEVKALHFILENMPRLVSEVDDGLGPLTQMLESGQASGDFAAFDARIAAVAIRSVIDRAAFHLTEHGEITSRYIEETIHLLERMVHDPRATGTKKAKS
jgi:TetR/AcrR family transcriptional regulator